MKNKPTLSSEFSKLRAESLLSLQSVANLCDISDTTVLKVEAGRPVRWETLHMILTVGLNVKQGTVQYNEFHRLWLEQRAELAESHPADYGEKKLPPHSAAAVKKFRTMVRDLDVIQTRKLMASIGRSISSLSNSKRVPD